MKLHVLLFATITLNFTYNELQNIVEFEALWLSCGRTLTYHFISSC